MRKRILVVDDDCSVRESLKKVLEETGYEVILASDGREAEGRLNDPEMALLILDLNMPHRDGWDVLEEANSNCPLLPVIVITGIISQLESLSIPGVAALMEKPIEVPLLLQKIADLLAETAEERLRRINRSLESDWWCQINGARAEGSGMPQRLNRSRDFFAE